MERAHPYPAGSGRTLDDAGESRFRTMERSKDSMGGYLVAMVDKHGQVIPPGKKITLREWKQELNGGNGVRLVLLPPGHRLNPAAS